MRYGESTSWCSWLTRMTSSPGSASVRLTRQGWLPVATRRTAPHAFSCASDMSNSAENGSAGRPLMRKLIGLLLDVGASGGAQDAKLLQCSGPVVEPDLFRDLPIAHAQHGGAGEPHLASRCRRQRPDE